MFSLNHLTRYGVLLLTTVMVAACGGQATLSADEAAAIGEAVNMAMQSPLQQIADDMGTPNAASALPVNEAGQPIVARVNEVEILQAELDRTMSRFEAQQIPGISADVHRLNALNALIDQVLIEQAATEQSVSVTPEEVQTEIAANVNIAGSQENWNTWLTQNMYTPEEFERTLYETLLTARMRDRVTQDLSSPVPHVRARHILVATELQANEVIARLNSGEDFGALASHYSSDVTTREQGGDLGWFAQGELLEPYLSEVAFSLQPGQVAGPIATSLGFHVVQVIERADQPVPEEKRALVAQGQFELWVQSLRSNAEIELY